MKIIWKEAVIKYYLIQDSCIDELLLSWGDCDTTFLNDCRTDCTSSGEILSHEKKFCANLVPSLFWHLAVITAFILSLQQTEVG